MVACILGLLVGLGGLWTHSSGLALLGVLAILFGGRAVAFLASEEHAHLRVWWGRFLDGFLDSNCLVLNLLGLPFLLFGFWAHNVVAALAGIIIAGIGHYHVQRDRIAERGSGSSREDAAL